jgi:hypothetical protein
MTFPHFMVLLISFVSTLLTHTVSSAVFYRWQIRNWYQQNHEVRKCHGFIMKQLKEKCADNKTRLLTHTHTKKPAVGTVWKSNKNRRKRQKSIPLTHVCMTAHFPGLILAFQYRCGVAKLILYGPKSLFSTKWYVTLRKILYG